MLTFPVRSLLKPPQLGLAFGSGSATTATICSLWKAGDHIIAMDDLYGGTYRYFTKVSCMQQGQKVDKTNTIGIKVASNFDLKFTFVDLTDVSKLKAAITDRTKASTYICIHSSNH